MIMKYRYCSFAIIIYENLRIVVTQIYWRLGIPVLLKFAGLFKLGMRFYINTIVENKKECLNLVFKSS